MSSILFVGINPTLTKMTSKLLRRHGFDVQSIVGIQAALTAVQLRQTDVIIADLELDSDMREQFCQSIKQKDRRVRILMITENGDDEIPTLNAGADDWMKKPYQMGVLYARVNALLRQCV